MKAGLFEIQANQLREFRQARQAPLASLEVVYAMLGGASAITYDRGPALQVTNATGALPSSSPNPIEFARCFLRLANLPNFALDRLSRHEATLSRQVDRILYALEALDRRKPQKEDPNSVSTNGRRGTRFPAISWPINNRCWKVLFASSSTHRQFAHPMPSGLASIRAPRAHARTLQPERADRLPDVAPSRHE